MSESPKYRGLLHGISEILKSQGIGGIYKGLFPTILKQGTNQGVRFLVYEECKGRLMNIGLNQFFSNVVGGAIAGGASVFVNNPIDVVKTNM